MRSLVATDIHQAARDAQALPCEIPSHRLSTCISSISVCFILPALAESERICAPNRVGFARKARYAIPSSRRCSGTMMILT